MTRKGFFQAIFGFGTTSAAMVDASTHSGWRSFICKRQVIRRPVAISDCQNGHYVSGTQVFLNGEPVWKDCCYAEEYGDGTGLVVLYLRNEHGMFYLHGMRGAAKTKTVLRGKVQIVPPSTISPKAWKALQERWLQGDGWGDK